VQVLEPLVRIAGMEVVIADDSRSDYTHFVRHLGRSHFLVEMNDLHEIRAYNRVAKFSTAPLLSFMQDDDAPPTNSEWSDNALTLTLTLALALTLCLLTCCLGYCNLGYCSRGNRSLQNLFTRESYSCEHLQEIRCCNGFIISPTLTLTLALALTLP